MSNVWHASDDDSVGEGNLEEESNDWETSSASTSEGLGEVEKNSSSSMYVQKTRLFSSDADFQEEDRNSSSGDSMTAIRQVVLQWPLEYSHRMQFVRGNRYTGYYFPSAQKNIEEQQGNNWLCVYAEDKANVFSCAKDAIA